MGTQASRMPFGGANPICGSGNQGDVFGRTRARQRVVNAR